MSCNKLDLLTKSFIDNLQSDVSGFIKFLYTISVWNVMNEYYSSSINWFYLPMMAMV